jgi:hypothetical protein
MEYYAVVVTAFCQLCKVLAGLQCTRERSWNLKISHRLRNEERIDILEEHDPNKALVGCYLDLFLRLRILVLAYRVSERKFESGVLSLPSRGQNAAVRADNYTTTSFKEAYIEFYNIDKAHRPLEQNSFSSFSGI